MPGEETEQPPISEAEATHPVVHFDEPFSPFAPGQVRPIRDLEGNHGLEAVIELDPSGQELFGVGFPRLPFHFVLLESELAKQHQAGPAATSALTPLGTQGYQVTQEDYDPVQRVRKFEQWRKRENIPFDQAALWLHATITDEEIQRLKLSEDPSRFRAPLRAGIPFLLRQIEVSLDFGTGEPLAAKPGLTALQVGEVAIARFYPQKTGPLAVPVDYYGMRSMSADDRVSWLTEGLGVYLPKEKAPYERTQATFRLVPEKPRFVPKPRL